ncbi:MAG: hypothetical protein KDD53_01010, partial [Bdellovibrionales bacterium]|nr:hypothetical protein [Bdellovibrionales bacterium]
MIPTYKTFLSETKRVEKYVQLSFHRAERLLAHLSGDSNLIESFQNEIDIHSKTAREILGLSTSHDVSDDERRIGKTINFGIIYGMSAFRLARELGIPFHVAKEYIDNYFA